MTMLRMAVLAAALVCLGGGVLAQEEEPRLSNWGAPPYWNPTVQRAGDRSGETMMARAQGLQAQAEGLPSSPLPFVAIEPCRIVDTRIAKDDGFHSPNFADDEARTFPFPLSPTCAGLPVTAGAWSVNVQFRPISQLSYLTAYPTGTTMPGVSTLTAGPAAWVQNAAIVPAGTDGAIDIYCQYAGRVVIDINGYYGPQSVVTSLNTLIGDLTLAEGSNVTITPSAGTLTIAATGGPGGDLPVGSTNQTLRNNGSAWVASSALTNDGTNVAIAGRLGLVTTTATAGQITLGTWPFLHGFLGNTFLGSSAGNFTMGGTGNQGRFNVGLGTFALTSNSTGSFNTATGTSSLASNTTGAFNTAVGTNSLNANTSGEDNTATGNGSLTANTEGSSNTAIGADALRHSTTANQNTAVGAGALYTQSYDDGAPWDSDNTAVGYHALFLNQPTFAHSGIMNSALGSGALAANTTGTTNTAVGASALGSNTTGSDNIGVGTSAGYSLTTGSYNIDIGNNGAAGDGNTIRIGTPYSGGTGQNRAFIAGISGVTVTGSAVLVSSTGQLGVASSSIRVKQDVENMDDASSRVMELRPVTFRYRARPDGPLQYGLIAEEVEQVMPELVVHDATGRPEAVAYHELPSMLLNELRKQHVTIQAQQAQIEELRNQVRMLLEERRAARPQD